MCANGLPVLQPAFLCTEQPRTCLPSWVLQTSGKEQISPPQDGGDAGRNLVAWLHLALQHRPNPCPSGRHGVLQSPRGGVSSGRRQEKTQMTPAFLDFWLLFLVQMTLQPKPQVEGPVGFGLTGSKHSGWRPVAILGALEWHLVQVGVSAISCARIALVASSHCYPVKVGSAHFWLLGCQIHQARKPGMGGLSLTGSVSYRYPHPPLALVRC